MSVRVVPSLAQVVARECGEDFELQCDPAEEEWARSLAAAWRARRAPLPELGELFARSREPYATAVRVALRCGDNQQDFGPKTLPYIVVDRLRQWAAKNAAPLRPQLVRFVAFNVAAGQKNAAFVNLVVDAFGLKELGDALLPPVRAAVADRNYKMACHFVVALDMQAHFTTEELIVPLFLQDKLALIDELLDSRPRLAADFIKYLDDLVKHKNVVQRIHLFLADTPVPDVKWDKMYHKPIGKLIVRLCKKYSVDPDACENLAYMRAYRGLRFLVRQKYGSDSAMSDEAWNDLVTDALDNTPELLKEVVSMVVPYDAGEAFKWAQKYCLPEKDYPEELTFELSRIVNDININDANDGEETVPTDPDRVLEYYTLRIPLENVIIVNERISFDTALKHLKDLTVIGLDSEWKPSFGAKASSVSLIQMASKDRVFIFDVLALNAPHLSDLWHQLADVIFNNTNIVKLGFGVNHDMKEIITTIPGLNSVKYKGLGYLDLGQLWRSVAATGVQLPYPKISSGEGLNSIVEQCFGTCLNKNEQCSNWENRPLRTSQIQYAALDAHVLIEIYQIFSSRCVNFEEICYQIMEKSGLLKIKKKNLKDRIVNKTNDGHMSENLYNS